MRETPVFEHKLTVPFQDIDAAGVVFYAHLFRYAHEAYEDFMQHIGHSLQDMLAAGSYLLPVVHAQADYRRPLHHADKLNIELRLTKLGRTSFTLDYRVLVDNQTEHASLQTVHVALDRTRQGPQTLPAPLQAALARLIPDSDCRADASVNPGTDRARKP